MRRQKQQDHEYALVGPLELGNSDRAWRDSLQRAKELSLTKVGSSLRRSKFIPHLPQARSNDKDDRMNEGARSEKRQIGAHIMGNHPELQHNRMPLDNLVQDEMYPLDQAGALRAPCNQ